MNKSICENQNAGVIIPNNEKLKHPAEDGDKAINTNDSSGNLLFLIKKLPENMNNQLLKDGSNQIKSALDLEEQWKLEAEKLKIDKDDSSLKIQEEKNKQIEEENKRMEERNYLREYINEAKERISFRTSLREENLRASEIRPDESFFSKLDSNLKKNTAFVKKLRTLTESQKETIIKDFKAFNLTKYVGEIASALVEAKLKMSDINCALTISSLMHQRYVDFSAAFLENWQKNLLSKKDDKIGNLSKLRVDLRFFADLISIGIFTEKEALSLLANQLNLLTCNDKEEHNNLTIIISFCKHCGDDYAGLVSKKFKILAEKYSATIQRSEFLKSDRQKACKYLFKEYYLSLSKHLISNCKELRNLEKQNRRILQTKGELNSERKEKYEILYQNFQKLFQNAAVFADLLDEDLPELPEEDLKSESDGMNFDFYSARSNDLGDFNENGLFEDEDTRQFYETLPDLKAIIPGILYKDSEQCAPSIATEGTLNAEDDLELIDDTTLEMLSVEENVKGLSNYINSNSLLQNEALSKSSESKEPNKTEDLQDIDIALIEIEDEDVEIVGTMKQIWEVFSNNLPNCVNRDLIDKAATDFCMNLNTKSNRKKLVKTLFQVQRTRYDLLPFYSRLVAILSPCMPSLSSDLATMLKNEFRYHVRKKDQINIESKLKIVRFIGELVKFNMFGKTEVLNCIKMLLADFVHHNIEMTCALLESCGRFLYRSQDSHHRIKLFLNVMMRKKAVFHMDSRYTTLIENAFYYSNPPDIKAESIKQRPPLHEYIRHLLYKELSKHSIERVLKQFRKLNWNDFELKAYAIKCLSSIWNVRYNCIHCCANVLAGLILYQNDVVIHVIDNILEDIRLGMEVNHPKFNQHRLSTIKFLGELYNYTLVESNVIFKTLYSLITFATSLDESMPSLLDPPEHLFRIRLVCILLDSCGQYFDRGLSKKKLDFFLIYFQRYFWFKKKNSYWGENCPFPNEINYLVLDTLEYLKPKLKLSNNWEEAYKAAEEIDEEYKNKIVDFIKSNPTTTLQSNILHPIQEVDFIKSNPTTTLQSNILLPIQEEETTQESSRERMTNDSDQENQSLSLSQSQKGDFEEEFENIRLEGNEKKGDADTAGEDDDFSQTISDDNENSKQNMYNSGVKHIKCPEDDDFLTAFDKMMLESIQTRQQDLIKIPVVEIAVPVNIKTQVKSKTPALNLFSNTPPDDTEASSSFKEKMNEDNPSHMKSNTIAFTVLTRKGNKPQFATLDIPISEKIASKFTEQKQVEKAEKEKMKKVVLGIHERQEEEDFMEMMALNSRTSSHISGRVEKKSFYQHQRGAPDADAIFGLKRR